MRTQAVSQKFSDRTAAILNATQHEISGRISILSRVIEDVEHVALDTLAHDKEALTRKIELINRVSDKVAGLITAVPVPVPDLVVDVLEVAAQKLRDKVIGDMEGEMTSAMSSAEACIQQERMVLLCELHTKRVLIAVQTRDLIEKHRSIMEGSTLPKNDDGTPLDKSLQEVVRYEQLREIEKGLSALEAFTATFNAQMASLGRATTAAKEQAREIATQSPETGHQESVKRMPEQHSMTQAMYQRAVLKYMETRFTDVRSAPLLKSEEIKMLEQAFPNRFVMDRTPAGEWAKQRAEFGREVTKIRVAERATIESTLDKDAIRDKVARDEAASRFRPKTGAALRNAQEKAIQDELDRLMKQRCGEHVIEHRVRTTIMVPSPLDPSTQVCPSTAERHRKEAMAIDPDAAVSGVAVTVAPDAVLKISSFRAGAHTKDCIHAILEQERQILKATDHNDPYFKDDRCTAESNAVKTEAARVGAEAGLDIAKAQMFREALSDIIALAIVTDDDKASRVERIVQFEQDFEARFGTSAASELSHFESFMALQSEKIAHVSHVAEIKARDDELGLTKASISDKITVLKEQLLQRTDRPQFNPATTTAMCLAIEDLDRSLKSLSGRYEVQKTALAEIDASVSQCTELLVTMSKTDPMHYNSADVHKFPSVVHDVIATDTSAMTLDQKVAHDHLAAAVIAQYRLDPHVMQDDITSLRRDVAIQATVLKDYQAMHEIERTTPASVRADIDNFRVALEDEITRISAKGLDAVTARKVSLLRAEVNNLDLLKGMVDTHVSFASIQRRLTEVVTHVMDAAKIQRGLIHTTSTSTTKNLSKFEALKDILAQRRAEVEYGATSRMAAGDGHSKAPVIDEGVRELPRLH